jgi:hypothetical protein
MSIKLSKNVAKLTFYSGKYTNNIYKSKIFCVFFCEIKINLYLRNVISTKCTRFFVVFAQKDPL